MNNCKKCDHFYRTMTDENGQGYNPAPFCHRWEDEGKSPDYFNKSCFKKRLSTRRKNNGTKLEIKR